MLLLKNRAWLIDDDSTLRDKFVCTSSNTSANRPIDMTQFSIHDFEEEINLAPFVDPSPPTVVPTTTLAHVFRLFNTSTAAGTRTVASKTLATRSS